MKKSLKQQRGLTMSGFLMVIVLLAGVAIFAMKLIPAYMENGRLQKAFDAITADPAMQTATVAEIRGSFQKRAVAMDDVRSVDSNDIEISKEGGKLALSVSYSKKIPLAGNVSLLLEFNPSSPK